MIPFSFLPEIGLDPLLFLLCICAPIWYLFSFKMCAQVETSIVSVVEMDCVSKQFNKPCVPNECLCFLYSYIDGLTPGWVHWG